MAFNKEWMITWDELAPSLQSLFKDLQTQITENTNQITTINKTITNIQGDITNINNNITKIQGDITNINTTINNYGDRLETIETKGMFLNMAPKIGYYQNDTVQVLASYNMNCMFWYGFGITSDNAGQQILYYIANDGSKDTLEKGQMYRATRSTEQSSFIFDNDKVAPPCLNEVKYYFKWNDGSCKIMCDNDYLVLLCNDEKDSNYHLYMIYTNNSSDYSTWTQLKDLTALYNGKNDVWANNTGYIIYLVKPFISKNIIAVFYKGMGRQASYDNDNTKLLYLKIYRLDNLSVVREIAFDNILARYIHIPTDRNYNRSFSKTKQTNTLTESGSEFQNFRTWQGDELWYDYENEYLYLYGSGMIVYSWRPQNNYAENYDYRNFKISWKLPQSIMNINSTGNPTLYSTRDDFDDTKSTFDYSNNDSTTVRVGEHQRNITYDTQNKKMFFCDGITYGTITQDDICYGYICKSEDQKPGDNPKDWGGRFYNKIDSIYAPDASMWGKAIYKYSILFDHVILACKSKGSLHWVWVNKWQWKDKANWVIEPVPGQYKDLSEIIPLDLGQYCSNMWSFCAKTETGIRYLSQNYNVENGNCMLYHKELKWNGDNNNPQFSTVSTKSIPCPTYTKEQLDQVFTDCDGNYIVIMRYASYDLSYSMVFCQNGQTDPVKYPHARKMYFATYGSDGRLIKYFGSSYESKWSGIWRWFNDTYHNNLPNKIGHIEVWVNLQMDKYTWLLRPYHWSNSDYYGSACFKLTFNKDLTDFTMSEAIPMEQSEGYYSSWTHAHYVDYNSTLGITQYGRTWEPPIPMIFRTQNPLLEGQGKSYTEAEFLSNINNCNKYYMYLQSAQGLVAYVPNIPIFLGGYFSIIENPIEVPLYPNANNYIYLERDNNDRTKIIASCSTTLTIQEGSRQFSKICIAKVVTDSSKPISTSYYKINIGYNDYIWNK